jgi:N-acetyl-anhydromuramyl-L-alanine amidase AmpD
VLGHSDIAPERKLDPGIFFDWQLLDHYEIGIKMDIYANIISLLEPDNAEIAPDTLQRELKNIGYKIEVTGIRDQQTNYVIRAFLAHFYPKGIWNKGGIRYYQDMAP